MSTNDEEWMLDASSHQHAGGEPFLGLGDRIFCPKCSTEITDGPGYGLAFGGCGTYWACEQDGCDWFYKIMDAEEANQ